MGQLIDHDRLGANKVFSEMVNGITLFRASPTFRRGNLAPLARSYPPRRIAREEAK